MPDKKPVLIAQYGTKHAHARGHAQTLAANPDVEFCGVFEPDDQQRLKVAEEEGYRGVRWYDSAEQMLQEDDLAALAIEGEVAENLAFSRRALEAGKHIWLDKPAGADLEVFTGLIEQARADHLFVQLGYMFRYNEAFKLIGQWVEEGMLGEIFSIRGRMSSGLPTSSRQALSRYPGGMVFELLCHLTDVVISLLGRPERVHSHLRNELGSEPEFRDNTMIVMEFGGAMAHLESTAMELEASAVRRFEIYGTKGSATMMPLEPPQLRLCLDEARGGWQAGWQDVPVDFKGRYIDDVIAFVADIRGEKSPDRSLDHELTVQETVLRAARGLG